MSSMELNKGKLVLCSIDTEHFTEENYEDLWDNGYVQINGEIYQVENHVRDTDFCDTIAQYKIDEYGDIEFLTYHYNGGAGWTEVLEHEMNKGK